MIRYKEELCTGSKSIQDSINLLAKKTGRNWAKNIQSPEWREKARLALQDKTNIWCDYRAGTCVCDEVVDN